jgi:4-hydroxybenzoate polyprenyltransferase
MVFGLQMTSPASLARSFAAFLSFGMAASGSYVLNDLRDLAEDKNHPVKSRRPIAAGLIAPAKAVAAVVVLWLGTLIIAWKVNVATVGYVSAYLALNSLYSFGLKKIPILDTLMLAAGYVIRVLVGSAAVGVTATPWILTVTFFVALVLGFGKRRSEIAELKGRSADCREVLDSYTLPLLDSFILISVSSTIITYALYVVESETSGRLGDGGLILTLPFVVFGLFRYLHLLHTSPAGSNPTKTVMTDKPLGLTVLGWLVTVVLALYLT